MIVVIAAAASGLQPARDERPGAAACGRPEHRERHHEQPGQPAKVKADQGDAEATDVGLALAADVEQAAVERDRDREAGEDEARGVKQRVADRLAIAEGAVDQKLDRLERVLAEEQHDQAGDEERRGEVEQRQQPEVHPGRQLTRARGHQTCFQALTHAAGARPGGAPVMGSQPPARPRSRIGGPRVSRAARGLPFGTF